MGYLECQPLAVYAASTAFVREFGIADMGLYETFMLGFAVLVILAGVVFSVAAAFMPGPRRHQLPTPPNNAAAGGGDEEGAAGNG